MLQKNPEGKRIAPLESFLYSEACLTPGKPCRFGKNRRSQFFSFCGRLALPGSCVTTVGRPSTPHETVTQGNEVTAGWINIGPTLACGYQ